MANAEEHNYTDVFLTHAWKDDELERNTHARVSIINKQLRRRGFTTWFDEEKMEGDTRQQMQRGIDETKLVMVFLTKKYAEKLDSDSRGDSVKLEYNYGFNIEKPFLYIAFEPYMVDHDNWRGQLLMTSQNALYVSVDKELDDVLYLKDRVKELVSQLEKKGIMPSKVTGRQCSVCDETHPDGTYCKHCGRELVSPPLTPAYERGPFFDEKEPVFRLCPCENIETQPTTCRFVGNGEKFVTLNISGMLQIWDTETRCCVKESVEANFAGNSEGMAGNSSKVVTKGATVGAPITALEVYPNGSFIVVCANNVFHWLESRDLQIEANYDVRKDGIERVNNFKISRDGLICVLGTEKKGFVCYNISDLKNIRKTGIRYSPNVAAKALDLHQNNKLAVCSYYNAAEYSFVIDIWDVTSGEQFKRINEDKVAPHVKWVQNADQILYVVDGKVHLVDMEGEHVFTFDTKVTPQEEAAEEPVTVIPNERDIVIAGADKSLRVYDAATRNQIGSLSGDSEFIVLDSNPSKWVVLALDAKKSVFILRRFPCMRANTI